MRKPFDEVIDETAPPCPLCGGDAMWLGWLGRLAHFRCRCCGWDWAVDDAPVCDSLLAVGPDDGGYGDDEP